MQDWPLITELFLLKGYNVGDICVCIPFILHDGGEKIDALQLTSRVTNLGAYVHVKASCLCLAIGNVTKFAQIIQI